MEAERKAHHQHRASNLHLVQRALKVSGSEAHNLGICGKGFAIKLNHCNVDFASEILPLAPYALAVAVKQHRQADRAREIERINVKL